MEWFCTTSFRSDVFQMGLLSALEQFLCSAPPPPPLHTTHTYTHTHHRFFSSLYSHAERMKKKEWKRSWYLWQSWGQYQLCLIAEVFDLINDTGLHCEPNHKQIKKVGDVKDAEGKSAALLSPFRVDSLQREGIFSTYSLICSPIARLASGYISTPSRGSRYLPRFHFLPAPLSPTAVSVKLL